MIYLRSFCTTESATTAAALDSAWLLAMEVMDVFFIYSGNNHFLQDFDFFDSFLDNSIVP